MSLPKLFIASSSRALNLAKALKFHLDHSEDGGKRVVDAGLWTADSYHSATILQKILDACGESHFFVAILTKDDMAKKKNKLLAVPRDNCIFELGLFIGRLNLDPKRCSMLTTLDEDALPSDLKGHIYERINDFDESQNLSDFQKCKEALASLYLKVEEKAKDLGPCGNTDHSIRVISTKELMARENTNGWLKSGSSVVVSSNQPLERADDEFARIVLSNMLNQEVEYNYFFSCHESPLRVAQLFHQLATLNLSKPGVPLTTNQISERLQKLQDKLRIYPVAGTPPFQYCVHNACDDTEARCYLRYFLPTRPQEYGFTELYRGSMARGVTKNLCSPAGLQNRMDNRWIFPTTLEFDSDRKQKEISFVGLRKQIETLFTNHAFDKSLRKLVFPVCFGDSMEQGGQS